MTGLAEAIHEGGGVLKSCNPAIMLGGEPVVIVEAIVGDDPEETDPENDDE